MGALSLFFYNQHEADLAADASAEVMPKILEQIQINQEEQARLEAEDPSSVTIPIPNTPLELLTEEDKKMTEEEIDGESYIGYIIIPSLSIELPVMSEWSYPRLKKAPCRYRGTLRGEDLVIMAHNYTGHFSSLSGIELNAEVIFVDMDGVTTQYHVVATDILSGEAVEEMTSGEYDLTLFTCTYGGKSRVTVRCDMDK